MRPIRIVVMGVASSGKSTVGERLAARLGAAFVDGDALHPTANVAKMAAGTPLDDDDRWPWLERVRNTLATDDRIVIACSALRRSYRDVIRGAEGVRFVFLELDEATASRRAERRTDHFMGAEMVASQFATLEPPTHDETDVITVEARQNPDDIIAEIIEQSRSSAGDAPPQ